MRDINAAIASSKPGTNARKAGRLRCELVQCDLGEVTDLSSTGMRVNIKGVPGVMPGNAFSLVIMGPGVKVTVGARLVWIKKAGLFRSEAGIEFIALSAEAKTSFAALVRAIVA